jgi:hypothetical protein
MHSYPYAQAASVRSITYRLEFCKGFSCGAPVLSIVPFLPRLKVPVERKILLKHFVFRFMGKLGAGYR